MSELPEGVLALGFILALILAAVLFIGIIGAVLEVKAWREARRQRTR